MIQISLSFELFTLKWENIGDFITENLGFEVSNIFYSEKDVPDYLEHYSYVNLTLEDNTFKDWTKIRKKGKTVVS